MGCQGSVLSLEGFAASSPHGQSPSNEGPERVLEPMGKWLNFNFRKHGRSVLVLTAPRELEVDAVAFRTARDMPARDPVSFRVEGARHGSDEWFLLYEGGEGGAELCPTPEERRAWTPWMELRPRGLAPEDWVPEIEQDGGGERRFWCPVPGCHAAVGYLWEGKLLFHMQREHPRARHTRELELRLRAKASEPAAPRQKRPRPASSTGSGTPAAPKGRLHRDAGAPRRSSRRRRGDDAAPAASRPEAAAVAATAEGAAAADEGGGEQSDDEASSSSSSSSCSTPRRKPATPPATPPGRTVLAGGDAASSATAEDAGKLTPSPLHTRPDLLWQTRRLLSLVGCEWGGGGPDAAAAAADCRSSPAGATAAAASLRTAPSLADRRASGHCPTAPQKGGTHAGAVAATLDGGGGKASENDPEGDVLLCDLGASAGEQRRQRPAREAALRAPQPTAAVAMEVDAAPAVPTLLRLGGIEEARLGALVDVEAVVQSVGELKPRELHLHPGVFVQMRRFVLRDGAATSRWVLSEEQAGRYGNDLLGCRIIVRGAKVHLFHGGRHLSGCTRVDVCVAAAAV